MNDWIHTRRGVTLVEGTLPKLARGLEALTVELKRFNDAREALDAKEADFWAVKIHVETGDLPLPAEPCNEFCAEHDDDCDGNCDHNSDHTNACLSGQLVRPEGE